MKDQGIAGQVPPPARDARCGVFSVTPDGSVRIDDREVFTGDAGELLQAIGALVGDDDRHLVVTPNVDQVLNLSRYPEFNAVFAEADIRTLDGAPLVALARTLGARCVHRNTGADLLVELARPASVLGWRVAIVGGKPDVAARAVANLVGLHPTLDVRAVELPLLAAPDDPASERAIRELLVLQPDIVFLCIGSPKQELWYASWRDILPAAVYLAVGAAVDFVAGVRSRAPRWVQRMGLEWVWRLAQEPRRLAGRYLIRGPRFIALIAISMLARFLHLLAK